MGVKKKPSEHTHVFLRLHLRLPPLPTAFGISRRRSGMFEGQGSVHFSHAYFGEGEASLRPAVGGSGLAVSTAVGGVLAGAGAVDEALQQRQPSPFDTSCAVSAENGNVEGDGGGEEGAGGAEVSTEEDAADGGPSARAHSVPPVGSVPPPPPQQQLSPVLPSTVQQQQRQQQGEGEVLGSGTKSLDIDEELLELEEIRAGLDAMQAACGIPGDGGWGGEGGAALGGGGGGVGGEEGAAAFCGGPHQPDNLLGGGGGGFPSWAAFDGDDGGSEGFMEWESRELLLMVDDLDLVGRCIALPRVAPGG